MLSKGRGATKVYGYKERGLGVNAETLPPLGACQGTRAEDARLTSARMARDGFARSGFANTHSNVKQVGNKQSSGRDVDMKGTW